MTVDHIDEAVSGSESARQPPAGSSVTGKQYIYIFENAIIYVKCNKLHLLLQLLVVYFWFT